MKTNRFFLVLSLFFSFLFSAQDAFSQTISIAFGANIKSQVSIGRDNHDGIDLFTGDLDVATGRVTNIQTIDTNSGAQWFPAFSPNGTLLAYNTTWQGNNQVTVINPQTHQTVATIAEARFPSFSKDGSVIYFSRSGPAAGIYAYRLATKETTLLMAGKKQDPDVVDDHTLVYHDVTGQQAQPVLFNTETKQETHFTCPGCGHLTASATTLLASLPTAAGLMISRRHQVGDLWPSFVKLKLDFGSINMNYSQIIAAYPERVNDTHALISVMYFDLVPQKQLTKTSHLYVMELQGQRAQLMPLKIDGYPNAETCTSAVAVAASTASADLDNAQVTKPTSQPLLYVVINSRNHDPQVRGEYNYAQDAQAYQTYRQQLLVMTRFYKQLNIPWTLQTDWNFVEGVLAHEVKAHTINLSDTNGLNLLQYISQNGTNIEPFSHETQGYNYADVAALIEQAGVKPMAGLGGHIYDHQDPHFQNWTRFIAGQAGQKFPQYIFKVQQVSGASTFGHKQQTPYSGIWRPKSKEAFFTHDPTGQIITIADEKMKQEELQAFVTALQKGQYPTGRMYVASVSTTFAKQIPAQAVQELLNKRITPLLDMQNKGLIKIVDYLDLPKIWKERFSEQGNVVEIRMNQQR